MGSSTLSSLGLGSISGASAGSILGAGFDAISGIMDLRQKRKQGKAEMRQIDANQQLLQQQAQARAEDLAEARDKQESSARALLAATYGPDAFKSRGSSASAFQREGDRLFQRDLARNQSNLGAQTAGLEAQRSAVQAGMPSAIDYLAAIGGAGVKGYTGYQKGVKKTPPTLAPTSASPVVKPKRTGVLQYGAKWSQPGYGKTWWDR